MGGGAGGEVPILTVGCAISHSLGSEVVCGTRREPAEVIGKGAGGGEISRGSLICRSL